MSVDIFTTNYLAKRFCGSEGVCYYKNECAPQFFAQGFLGLEIRVIGNGHNGFCEPITERKYPKKGFEYTRGLGDRCGGVVGTDNPIEL